MSNEPTHFVLSGRLYKFKIVENVLAINFDIIHKSGSWFSYNDERLAQGKDAVRTLLENNKELYAEIEQKVRAAALENSDMLEIDETTDDEE